MAEYIEKTALVAEIERLKSIQLSIFSKGETEESCYNALSCISVYNEVLSLLDTLEVKGVDLEKELDYNDYTSFFKEHPDYSNGDWGFDECWVFAEYFYKLGIKAQRGE